METTIDIFSEEWERRALAVEDECGGISAGLLRIPDHIPIEPVPDEEEPALRKKIAEIIAKMHQKEAARKQYLQSMTQKQDTVNV